MRTPPADTEDNLSVTALFSIRPLVPTDLPAFKLLRDTCLRDFPEAFTSDYDTERHRSAESYASRLGAPSSGHCLWGAFDTAQSTSSELIGSIALERESRPQRKHLATVTAMMVQKRAQGRGIGPALLAACVHAAKDVEQLHQLILTVTATNAHVIRLYEKVGFVAYGLLPRAIHVQGQYHDKLHMHLDLDALKASQA